MWGIVQIREMGKDGELWQMAREPHYSDPRGAPECCADAWQILLYSRMSRGNYKYCTTGFYSTSTGSRHIEYQQAEKW